MVNHYENERIKYQNRVSRKRYIVDLMKDGKLRSVSEISKELSSKRVPISFQAIDKHLRSMVENKEMYLLNDIEREKELILRFHEKKHDSRINAYYWYTPLASKLYSKLNSLVKSFKEVERYHETINHLVKLYQVIEGAGKRQKYEATHSSAVRKNLQKEGVRLTEKNIKKQTEDNKNLIENYAKTVPKIKATFRGKKIGKKEYALIGKDFVSVDRYFEFLKLLEMDSYMKWVAYKLDYNREKYTLPLYEIMGRLFMEIVKESQKRF